MIDAPSLRRSLKYQANMRYTGLLVGCTRLYRSVYYWQPNLQDWLF
jgi:hypothetical protein